LAAKIYSLVNQKGGVGKTTSVINLGANLANMGHKVLIVDLDPQANATSCLGVDKNTVTKGTYEAILGLIQPSTALLANPTLGLTLHPSSPALAGAEVELVEMDGRESKLKTALATLADKFDYILIDCPPSLSILTINGLIAAISGVIIPVQCEYLALEGVGQLVQTIQKVQRISPAVKVRGVIMTMFESRANLSTDVVSEIKKFFPEQVFQTIIPRSIRLAEAPSYGLPITVYAPSSTGAVAYNALAKELLAGDGSQT